MSILNNYIPRLAVQPINQLLQQFNIRLLIVNERKTRHGDYRQLPDGSYRITVNANLNPYRFLITLVHEIAHHVAFAKYGRYIKPHGNEWKFTFQRLMLPLIRPQIFPAVLLPILAQHFKNPTASSDTDAVLSVALKNYDDTNDKNYIFELPLGTLFIAPNGRKYKKGNKLRKRYECLELSTNKLYVFQPNCQVQVIKSHG